MPLSQQYLPQIRSPNVLAIDGGGVRGLSCLLILKQIMERLHIAVGSESESVLQPWQIFDVICGTSTGGLIAIMLGRLRMGVDEAIEHYRDLSTTVFGSPRWFGGVRNTLLGTPVYDAATLERCIKTIVAQSDATHHNGEALLKEPVSENSDRLFKSYATEGTYKIWECARATTATYGFFDPMEIQAGTAPPITYLDGDLVANNPSKLAWQQVQNLFPGRPIGCFLSLGTGLLDVIQLKGYLIKIGISCQKLAKDCEAVADEIGEKFRVASEGHGSPYFRFSVNRGLEDIKFDEWTQESKLAAVTGSYMDFYEQEVALKGCINALKPKAEWLMAQRELI